MRQHRHPRRTVPNNPSPDNFDPADALETLHTEIVQFEACAHAAGEAISRLPPPSSPTERRDFARLYALVSRVANDATAAATHSDHLIAALSSHIAKSADKS
jgi:hypothetical protein